MGLRAGFRRRIIRILERNLSVHRLGKVRSHRFHRFSQILLPCSGGGKLGHADFADDADFFALFGRGKVRSHRFHRFSQILLPCSGGGNLGPTDFTDFHRFLFALFGRGEFRSHRFHRFSQISFCPVRAGEVRSRRFRR